jgi:hypothetical protein
MTTFSRQITPPCNNFFCDDRPLWAHKRTNLGPTRSETYSDTYSQFEPGTNERKPLPKL